MEFNKGKCKVMQFAYNNPIHQFTMGGFAPWVTLLEESRLEKDVGINVINSLKPIA